LNGTTTIDFAQTVELRVGRHPDQPHVPRLESVFQTSESAVGVAEIPIRDRQTIRRNEFFLRGFF
jgi:hypothetical protein